MPTLLIADDDKALRTVMSAFVRAEGWDVVEAANGREAVEAYAAAPTDVVLTDLLMPEIDGIGVVVQLRAFDPHVPVVVLTGLGTVERCREALKSGAADFLSKPCEPEELMAVIERAHQTRLSTRTGAPRSRESRVDLTWTVSADLAGKASLLNSVESSALDMGFARRSWSIRLALDEAFTNAVLHGAGADAGKEIEVSATFGADLATISVTDPGPGFSPHPDEARIPTGAGGRGLFLLRSFCDRVEWKDGGRTCRMTFHKGTRIQETGGEAEA